MDRLDCVLFGWVEIAMRKGDVAVLIGAHREVSLRYISDSVALNAAKHY